MIECHRFSWTSRRPDRGQVPPRAIDQTVAVPSALAGGVAPEPILWRALPLATFADTNSAP
jgi:hypothetical protein